MATLLSQENREYILAAEHGKRLESDELLGLVTQQNLLYLSSSMPVRK